MTEKDRIRKWRAMEHSARELVRFPACAQRPAVVRALLDLAEACEARAGTAEAGQATAFVTGRMQEA